MLHYAMESPDNPICQMKCSVVKSKKRKAIFGNDRKKTINIQAQTQWKELDFAMIATSYNLLVLE